MFTVSDYAAHYFPMVPLGWALQAAGHEVRLVCGPAQLAAAANTGLVLRSNGVDMDTVVQARLGAYLDARSGQWRSPGLPLLHPLTGQELAGIDDFSWADYEPEYVRTMAVNGRDRTRAVVGFARDWRPDLVVHDLMSPEGMLAGYVTGVPFVCHLWGPTGTDETGPGTAALSPDVPAAVRERLDIEPDLELLRYVIDPCPPAIAPPTRATRLPVRYVPYNGPGAMPAWVARPPEHTRICLVWSNSLTRIFGRGSFVVPNVVRACADLDVELVVALNDADADSLGAVPDNVRVLRNFPVHLLVPSSSVVVHHGGAGSMMTALTAGVPQLSLPLGPVLTTMADRLADANAGIVVPGYAADVATVRDALSALLGEEKYTIAAQELAQDNAGRPSPADLVGTLEQLAGGASCA